MSENRENFIPFSECPITLLDEAKPDEAQSELLKQLTAIGPLKVQRRANFYQAIEERIAILGLKLSHEEIYSLALLLNRNPTLAKGKDPNQKSDTDDPDTWIGPKADLFNQIKNMFPAGAFANPALLKDQPDFIADLNIKLQQLSSPERKKVLESLRNSSVSGGQSKLRIEVSDQHYSLSYYNESGQQVFIGNRRQLYSDTAVVTSAPRTPKENLEKARKDIQDMPLTANDFTRASLFRNLIRAVAATKNEDAIDWRDIKVDEESLAKIFQSKSMDVTIEGTQGNEKIILLTGHPPQALFAMYAKEVGVGQVLNQTQNRGAHLAEGLRMALLDTKTPQTTLIHLKHIATFLKTAASSEIYDEILNGINKSLMQLSTPLSVTVNQGQLRLLRNGIDIPNMSVQLQTSLQNTGVEKNRLQNLVENVDSVRILRKAIESLATAQTPLERLQAAAVYLQEGLEKASFYHDGKNYTFNFQSTKVDEELKNVEISIREDESLKSLILAKGLISFKGKNVRVIESTRTS